MPLHVLSRNENWLVKEEGALTALSVHPTQNEAIEAGRKKARAVHEELIIHTRDGRVINRE